VSGVDDSGGHALPSISPKTPLKLPLAWTVTAVVSLACIVSGATTMYLAIRTDLAGIRADLQAHVDDHGVHLDPTRTMAHGYPVGSADYAMDIYRLTESIGKLTDRPVMVGRDCRQTLAGFICDQKRP
jgi:hypothetical protein